MASSKASPSSRLVFCLLISAAILRPGEQGPWSGPGLTWARGSFLVFRPWLLSRGYSRRRVVGEIRGRPSRHRPGPGLSHLCRSSGLTDWLKFGQRAG